MAGRKQHFIQRLLLKGFSFDAAKGCGHIWVYRKDGNTFSPSREKYGAERDFYGNPEQSELDNDITELENHCFNNFLEDARTKQGHALEANNAAEFAIHVFSRSKNIRSTLTSALEQLMACSLIKLRAPSVLEKLLASAIRQQGNFFGGMLGQVVGHQKSVRLARELIATKSPQIDSLLNKFEKNIASIVADAHRKALSERLVDFRGARAEQFKSMRWHVLNTEKHLVLGDSVAVAELADGTFKPISEPKDALVRVWIPISYKLALVGSLNGKIPVPNVDQINRGSASCSYDAFCAFAGPNEHASLRPLIRTMTFSLDQYAVERIVDECIKKALA